MYSIKDLENLSGIKAHTIRIWEKRYGILNPQRTDTNIRLYDNDQLRKLLNIATLVSYGWKISEISTLPNQKIQEEIKKWLDDYSADHHAAQLNSLIESTTLFDQTRFEKIIDDAARTIGFKNTVLQLIYPFLNRVGMLWRLNELIPAQEHFASNIVKRKMHVAINDLPEADPQKNVYLLFLMPNEQHEIALLLGEFLIRSAGHHVVYLGPDVPISNVIETANSLPVDYLLSLFITAKPKEEIQENVRIISNAIGSRQFLISGSTKYFDDIDLPDNTVLIKSIVDLEAFV